MILLTIKYQVKGAMIRLRMDQIYNLDSSTKFFFHFDRKTTHQRQIETLKFSTGDIVTSRDSIKREIYNFFSDLFMANDVDDDAI